MRRKLKFIASILSLAASMAFLAVGIYAAGTAKTATISSTVSFTGDSVYATVAVYNGVFPSAPAAANVTNSIGSKTFGAGTSSQSFTNLTAAFTETNKFYAVKIVITNTNTAIPFTVAASKKADLGAATTFAALNASGTAINTSLIVNSAPTADSTLNSSTSSVTLLYIYELTSVDIADIPAVAFKNISISLTRV
jgi:hypothetical protein